MNKNLVIILLLAMSTRAQATGPLLIEAYGDSTTLGTSCDRGQCSVISDNAVQYLQTELRANFGSAVEVTNLGIGGTTATQLLSGNDRNPVIPWSRRMAASHARIVTINYGINEVMEGQTPTRFYDAETALVRMASENGKVAILETSNPMPDPALNVKLRAFVEMTRRVAREQHVPIIDQYAYILSLENWQDRMSDGAHPKASLYKLKADQDFSVIEPIVKALQAGKR